MSLSVYLTRLEKLVWDKHSSLLDPIDSYEYKEMLSIKVF
jgi:hypothetical protein